MTKRNYANELREHAKSIEQAANFFEEFTCGTEDSHVENLIDAAERFRKVADEYEAFQ